MALIKPSIYIFSEFSKHQQQAKKTLPPEKCFFGESSSKVLLRYAPLNENLSFSKGLTNHPIISVRIKEKIVFFTFNVNR